MIAEAIDTVLTLGWALAAWIVLTALAGALALHTVLAAVWRAGRAAFRACAWLYGRLRAEVPAEAHRLPGNRERPAQGRVWLCSARVPRSESPATGPSRPQGSRWSAPHGVGGGFPAPAPARRPERRTAPSWASTQPNNHEEAA